MFFRYLKSKKNENSKKDKEISLVVENSPPQQPFVAKVNKSLLLKHSPVFRTMDEKGEFKKSRVVKLKGITAIGLQKLLEKKQGNLNGLESSKMSGSLNRCTCLRDIWTPVSKLIRYIRTDSVFFQSHFEVIETLKAAYTYHVLAVNDVCSDFLINMIDRGNVCDIYEFSASYSFHQVEYHCLKFIDRNAEDVLKSPGFMTLKKITVEDIIKRHSLDVSTEVVIFRAVLAWGLNDCMRRGVDAEKVEEVLGCVKPLLGQVRFMAMSDQEMSDPDVDRFYKLLCAEDAAGNRRRSVQRTDSLTRSGTVDSYNLQQREYLPTYVYNLEVLDCDVHCVRNGETFYLRVEVLKGKVFLTGVTLAFNRFVHSRGNSCLYVALLATNVQTAEQVCTRGAFMNSGEEVMFPSPLVVKESESVEIALNVKRAVNICAMLIKGDSQIAVSDRKDVAMKIIPSTAGGIERFMFEGIMYFY